MSKLISTIIEYILTNYVNFYFCFKNSPFFCFSRNNNNNNETSILFQKKNIQNKSIDEFYKRMPNITIPVESHVIDVNALSISGR